MQIILLETLNKLGKAGEIVNVKDGFAKNFLIPKKKALIATKKNKDDLASKMSQINENNELKIKQANELKSKLDSKKISIEMEANEDGNLYGNLSPKLISERLNKEFSVELDTENIILGNVKELGVHSCKLLLYGNVSVSIDLEIVKKI
tara:strand:- start:10 stop:456 length:447 start_codon:yes stop_codon:yes gene_type:complete